MIHHTDFEYFATLDPAQQTRLLKCLKTGWENPDSGLGCYAMAPSDYDEFAPFFDAVCQEYHKASADATHVTDWDASGVGDKGVLDVTKLGLSELSMRVRVGRNLTQFNLPGAMDKAERIAFEKAMLKAFDKLKKDPAYGGTVYSLSPVSCGVEVGLELETIRDVVDAAARESTRASTPSTRYVPRRTSATARRTLT